MLVLHGERGCGVSSGNGFRREPWRAHDPEEAAAKISTGLCSSVCPMFHVKHEECMRPVNRVFEGEEKGDRVVGSRSCGGQSDLLPNSVRP